MLQVKDIPSPNFNDRPDKIDVNMLVMHYTGMLSCNQALQRLCDSNAKVSSHYLIDEDGTIIQLVSEDKQAWHAGVSCWQGKAALNENSIGIEIVNPGHEFGYREFPAKQMEAVLELSLDIISRHKKILPQNIVGHSDIAPTRKKDPGELFDWKYLAKNGVGIFPDLEGKKIKSPTRVVVSPDDKGDDVANLQKKLSQYGYFLKIDGYFGEKTESTVLAFKRHFIQDSINAFWTLKDQAILDNLLSLVWLP